jgi:hypothetical protein
MKAAIPEKADKNDPDVSEDPWHNPMNPFGKGVQELPHGELVSGIETILGNHELLKRIFINFMLMFDLIAATRGLKESYQEDL